MHRRRAALLTACDKDETSFRGYIFFSVPAHVTACVCFLWGACVQEHGGGACRHAGLCMCACAIRRIWRANISVHIAAKGYVGAITPTGKDRAVLIATF